MIFNTEVTVRITKEDIEGSSDSAHRNALSVAIRRLYPYLREVLVADRGIYWQNYGVGVKPTCMVFDHNPATLRILENNGCSPGKITLTLRAIRPNMGK